MVNVVEDKVALVDQVDREVSVVVVSKVDLVEVVLDKADLEVNEAVVKADLVVSEVVGLVALVVPVKAVLVWILKWDGRWMSLSKRFSTRHSTRGSSKLNFRFLVRWESLDPKLLRRLV